jgi:hypothetical protein
MDSKYYLDYIVNELQEERRKCADWENSPVVRLRPLPVAD